MPFVKGHKNSPAAREAGIRNLQEGKNKCLLGPNGSHGAYSNYMKQRYSDPSTAEGQRLNTIIGLIEEDLGGAENISGAQQVLLGLMRSKLMVILCISDYLDRQEDVVDKNSDLLGCVKSGLLSYSEAVRRDLETIFGFRRFHPERRRLLEDILKESKKK